MRSRRRSRRGLSEQPEQRRQPRGSESGAGSPGKPKRGTEKDPPPALTETKVFRTGSFSSPPVSTPMCRARSPPLRRATADHPGKQIGELLP
jgi:hypothetical protein